MSAILVPSTTPSRPAPRPSGASIRSATSSTMPTAIVAGATPRLAGRAARGPMLRSASGRLVSVPVHCVG